MMLHGGRYVSDAATAAYDRRERNIAVLSSSGQIGHFLIHEWTA